MPLRLFRADRAAQGFVTCEPPDWRLLACLWPGVRRRTSQGRADADAGQAVPLAAALIKLRQDSASGMTRYERTGWSCSEPKIVDVHVAHLPLSPRAVP